MKLPNEHTPRRVGVWAKAAADKADRYDGPAAIAFAICELAAAVDRWRIDWGEEQVHKDGE